MDKSMFKGMAIGGILVTAVTAAGYGGYKVVNKQEFAHVIAVKEVNETVRTPREECVDVVTQKQAPVKDENRVAGTAVGAIAGGLLGSTIGGGSGKTIATVAGAGVGGYAGNKVQKNMQQKDTVATMERQCKTVEDVVVKSLGYDVTYVLREKEIVVRLAQQPTSTKVPMKDGKPDWNFIESH